MKTITAVTTLALASTAAICNAAVLSYYNFEVVNEGSPGNPPSGASLPTSAVASIAAYTTASNMTASSFGAGAGLNLNGGGTSGTSPSLVSHLTGILDFAAGTYGATAGYLASTGYGTGTSLGSAGGAYSVAFSETSSDTLAVSAGNFTNLSTQLATAKSNNDYVSFTAAPSANFKLDLQSLTFQYGNSGGNQLVAFGVASSADGFASFLLTGGRTTSGQGFLATQTVDLTGTTFDALTSSIEFRIYFADNGSNTGRSHRVDNVTLNGEVLSTVPEPTSLGVLALAAVGFGRRRR